MFKKSLELSLTKQFWKPNVSVFTRNFESSIVISKDIILKAQNLHTKYLKEINVAIAYLITVNCE